MRALSVSITLLPPRPIVFGCNDAASGDVGHSLAGPPIRTGDD
ncbi:hypothetical protein BBAL3_334 [Brevundimonas sp. BAL3]|nr:hypothetical protein BBAL3_334 [Brevundimonas sp. BAL3]